MIGLVHNRKKKEVNTEFLFRIQFWILSKNKQLTEKWELSHQKSL